MSQVRREEKLAFAVVGGVLPVRVEPYDVRGRQGAVDALLHYPEGRSAALEVSSIGPDSEAGIFNFLGDRGYCKSIAGITHRWLVKIPRDFHPADMRKIDEILPLCEERSARHLSELAGEDRDVDDLLSHGVRADILTSDTRAADGGESRVYFVLPWMGGSTSKGAGSLPDELTEVLGTPRIQSKIDKLAATRLQERHLLLIVRPSAFSFPVYDGLVFGGPLPTEVPLFPNGLSQVWLLTRFRAGGVVRGISGHGWCRDYPNEGAFELAI